MIKYIMSLLGNAPVTYTIPRDRLILAGEPSRTQRAIIREWLAK